jgi:hypothetical protein
MPMLEESNKIIEVINEVCNDWTLVSLKTDFEKNNMILSLNNCNCCDRHQVNKPKNLEKYIETNFKGDDKSKYNCQCKCRIAARFICRSKYGFIEQ